MIRYVTQKTTSAPVTRPHDTPCDTREAGGRPRSGGAMDPGQSSSVADKMRLPRRKGLVTVSVAAHLLVVFGLWVAGMWKLERVEAGERPFDLAVAPQPPEDSGSPAGSPAPKMKAKKPHEKPKTIVKEPVQPEEIKKPDVVATAEATNTSETGTGTGTGSGSGSGSGNGLGSGSGSGSGSDTVI